MLATDVRHGREAPITANAAMEDEEARARAVHAALGDRGTETRAQTAIRFGLSHPSVATVVVGVAELAHVIEAFAAPGLGPLEEEALATLRPAWAAGDVPDSVRLLTGGGSAGGPAPSPGIGRYVRKLALGVE